jgi:pimeloyl-ACP methyl ester carboxylesterase
MPKFLYSILLMLFCGHAFSQNSDQPTDTTNNLDFEKLAPNGAMPYKWGKFNLAPTYTMESSTIEKHSGSRSLLIAQSNPEDDGFGSVAHVIPAKYLGKEVEFKAYMKLENVVNAAALMVRVDGAGGKTLAFNSMQNQKVNGTKDWAQYSIKTTIPPGAQYIYVAAILGGGGRLWIDDAEILFDGVDISKAKINPDYNPNSKSTLSYGNNAAVSGTVKLSNAKLYYETYGQGEPLLLLHGNSQSIAAFEFQIADLSKKFKVIAVDTRGQGQSSDETTGALSYDLFADDMRQLLDSLHIKKANILGWSDGGNTGLIMAVKYPEHVSKLAITGANLFPTTEALPDNVLKEVDKQLKVYQKGTDEHSKMEARLFTMLLNEPHLSFNDLKTIKCPVLVMAGEHDLILEQHTMAIAAAIPKSQVVIFKGATHYVPVDKPKEFNDAVINFFDK